jgi:hypothetical protein
LCNLKSHWLADKNGRGKRTSLPWIVAYSWLDINSRQLAMMEGYLFSKERTQVEENEISARGEQ